MIINSGYNLIFYSYPLWVYALILGPILCFYFYISLFVFKHQIYHYKVILTSIGLIQAISYILAISNEMIILFKAIESKFLINPSLIGFTILALGNSLAEILTNYSVAKTSPIMALTSCYGGVLFSNRYLIIDLMVGIGGSALLDSSIKEHTGLTFDTISVSIWIGLIGLIFGLFCTVIYWTWNGYKSSRLYGIGLILYSLVLLGTASAFVA